MSGPEALRLITTHNNSLEAEVYTTPIITPEGYNVSDPEQAELYLTEFHNITLPEPCGLIDAKSGFHLALALQHEDRAAIYENGQKQNVAEHTSNLVITTVMTALLERPDLNPGKVAIFAGFHDVVESYCGDTVITDPEAMKSKSFKEEAAMTLIRRDYAGHPILDYLDECKDAKTPEARYVKGKDKVEHYQLQLNNKAALHRERKETFESVVMRALRGAAIDHTAFSEMKSVFKEIGPKWNGWNCERFEGDPIEMVDNLGQKLLDLHPELRITALPPVDPHTLRNLGVAVLADRRHKNNPLTPTPAPSAQALASC